jgi:hypothetical protein
MTGGADGSMTCGGSSQKITQADHIGDVQFHNRTMAGFMERSPIP